MRIKVFHFIYNESLINIFVQSIINQEKERNIEGKI
jgi:hypothetical protein